MKMNIKNFFYLKYKIFKNIYYNNNNYYKQI